MFQGPGQLSHQASGAARGLSALIVLDNPPLEHSDHVPAAGVALLVGDQRGKLVGREVTEPGAQRCDRQVVVVRERQRGGVFHSGRFGCDRLGCLGFWRYYLRNYYLRNYYLVAYDLGY